MSQKQLPKLKYLRLPHNSAIITNFKRLQLALAQTQCSLDVVQQY